MLQRARVIRKSCRSVQDTVSVYKRGRIYRFKFHWNGKLVRQSTHQSKKRVAEELEAAHRTGLARGEVGIVTGRKRTTFSEYAKTFLDFIRARHADRPLTIKFYDNSVRHLLGFKPIADARLLDITEEVIERYIQHRLQTVEASAVDRELATLRRMLKLAVEKWSEYIFPGRDPANSIIGVLAGETAPTQL